jgi:3-methyl-2-oxobutanoate hydroxymethyltransferase
MTGKAAANADEAVRPVPRALPTVADLRAAKGRGQRTMLRVFTIEEAAAAEAAGIDIVSIPPDLLLHPRFREVAPTLFAMTGKPISRLGAGTTTCAGPAG